MTANVQPALGPRPRPHPDNPPRPLDLGWVQAARVDTSAVRHQALVASCQIPRTPPFRAAWLLKAVSFIDLTTLAGDDTPGNVRRLCAKALHPVKSEVLAALGAQTLDLTTAAVCVYHERAADAVAALGASGLPVAVVSTGFPAGLVPMRARLEEIYASVNDGAREIDIVIERGLGLRGEWEQLYDQISAYREACGDAHLKVILGTGELGSFTNVLRASLVAMMAGAHFIKTSTGKETVNATLAVSLVMTRAIAEYGRETGAVVGFKPAGGIRTAKDALAWMALLRDTLGRDWLEPGLFRFGASGLLTDIENALETIAFDRPAISRRQPLV